MDGSGLQVGEEYHQYVYTTLLRRKVAGHSERVILLGSILVNSLY